MVTYLMNSAIFPRPRGGSGEAGTYPREESIFESLQSGPRPFPTVLVIKPRAVRRHLTKILKKLTQEGFRLVALRLMVLTPAQAERLIPDTVQVRETSRFVGFLSTCKF